MKIPVKNNSDILKLLQGNNVLPKFNGEKEKFFTWRSRFLSFVHNHNYSFENKLLALENTLSSEVTSAVGGILTFTWSEYKRIIRKLEKLYGNKADLLTSLLNHLQSIPLIGSKNVKELQTLVNSLRSYARAFKEGGQRKLFKQKSIANAILNTCEHDLVREFRREVKRKTIKLRPKPLIRYLQRELEFLLEEKEACLNSKIKIPSVSYTYGEVTDSSKNPKAEFTKKDSTRAKVETENANGHANPKPRCTFCTAPDYWDKTNNVPNHTHIRECPEFLKLSEDDRMTKCYEQKRCYRCLVKGHRINKCPTRWVRCAYCPKNHNTLLHNARYKRRNNPETNAPANFFADDEDVSDYVASDIEQEEPVQQTSSDFSLTFGNQRPTKVSLRTVPIKVINKNKEIHAIFLLDDGTNISVISEEGAKQLELWGKPAPISLKGVAGTHKAARGYYSKIRIVAGDVDAQIDVQIIPNATDGIPVTDWNKYKHLWPHLRDIQFPACTDNTKVMGILGTAQSILMSAKEPDIVRGINDPSARHTPLGWTAIGLTEPLAKSANESFHFLSLQQQHSFYFSELRSNIARLANTIEVVEGQVKAYGEDDIEKDVEVVDCLCDIETAVIQSENFINARPLCRLSLDPLDFETLTPNSFLVNRLKESLYPTFESTAKVLTRRWYMMRELTDSVWENFQNLPRVNFCKMFPEFRNILQSVNFRRKRRFSKLYHRPIFLHKTFQNLSRANFRKSFPKFQNVL